MQTWGEHVKLHTDRNLSLGMEQDRWSCEAAALHPLCHCAALDKWMEMEITACHKDNNDYVIHMDLKTFIWKQLLPAVYTVDQNNMYT